MRRWVALLIAPALISGCSQPVDSQLKQELDQAAQAQGVDPLPMLRVLRSGEPQAYSAAKVADPFYPNDSDGPSVRRPGAD